MFIYLKNKKSSIFLLILLLTSACVRIIEDPVKKYNTEFLKNNSRRISRNKKKHLAIAKEEGIYYRNNETDKIDLKYYAAANGTKLKKSYKTKINGSNDEYSKKDIQYLDSDLSIYYRQRNLKDKEDILLSDDKINRIFYIQDNYFDYAKQKITFSDVEPTSEKLYGSLELRKEKEYNYISNQIIQENFDYIDIMNRVKKELYLKEKENSSNVKKNMSSVKSKFLKLFD